MREVRAIDVLKKERLMQLGSRDAFKSIPSMKRARRSCWCLTSEHVF